VLWRIRALFELPFSRFGNRVMLRRHIHSVKMTK